MDPLHIFYLCLLFFNFILYSKYWRENILTILFGMSLVAEIIVNALWYGYSTQYHIVYKIYVPLELSFVLFWVVKQENSPLSSGKAKVIICTYMGFSLVYYLLVQENFNSFPGILYNLSGVIIIVLCTFYIAQLYSSSIKELWRMPNFVIGIAFIFFYSSIFASNIVYSFLDITESNLASILRRSIPKIANVILYIMLIFAGWKHWSQKI